MKKSNKKAVSGIIATVLMIGLVIAIVGVVWVVITNLVTEQLDEAGSCFDVIGKVKINPLWTCYDSSSDEMMFLIEVGELDINEISVWIYGEASSKSFKLTRQALNIPDLRAHNESYEGNVEIPGKNSGMTYVFNYTSIGEPESIKIYPIIKGKQCEEETLPRILDCLSAGRSIPKP